MMTVSSVSRKTTRKTGTEKTSLAIAGNEQRESAGKNKSGSYWVRRERRRRRRGRRRGRKGLKNGRERDENIDCCNDQGQGIGRIGRIKQNLKREKLAVTAKSYRDISSPVQFLDQTAGPSSDSDQISLIRSLSKAFSLLCGAYFPDPTLTYTMDGRANKREIFTVGLCTWI